MITAHNMHFSYHKHYIKHLGCKRNNYTNQTLLTCLLNLLRVCKDTSISVNQWISQNNHLKTTYKLLNCKNAYTYTHNLFRINLRQEWILQYPLTKFSSAYKCKRTQSFEKPGVYPILFPFLLFLPLFPLFFFSCVLCQPLFLCK